MRSYKLLFCVEKKKFSKKGRGKKKTFEALGSMALTFFVQDDCFSLNVFIHNSSDDVNQAILQSIRRVKAVVDHPLPGYRVLNSRAVACLNKVQV